MASQSSARPDAPARRVRATPASTELYPSRERRSTRLPRRAPRVKRQLRATRRAACEARQSAQSKIKPTGDNSCLALPIGGVKEVAAPPTSSRSGEENGTRPARRLDLSGESAVTADSTSFATDLAELLAARRASEARLSRTRRARGSIRCASVARRGALVYVLVISCVRTRTSTRSHFAGFPGAPVAAPRRSRCVLRLL